MTSHNLTSMLRGITIIIAGILILSSCTKTEDLDKPKDDNPSEKNGDGLQVSDFNLQSTDGETVSLSDYAGKTVVLFFFGYNCPSCKAVAPTVESGIYQKYKNDDVVVLGIDTWGGNTSSLTSFKASTGVTFPVLEGGASVAQSYATTYDRIVIVGKDGDFVYKGTQVVSNELNAIVDAIETSIAEEPEAQEPKDTTSVITDTTTQVVEDTTKIVEEPVVVTPTLKIDDFTLSDIDGKSHTLSDYAGKVIVLYFFGYGCPSCKAGAPSLESDLQDVYGNNESFVLLGLDTWGGNQSSLESFKTTTEVSFPIIGNADDVASNYNTTYDRLLVVGQDGAFAFEGSRNASSDLEAVVEIVDELFK